MNTIIAPLDGSALSEEGLPIARELASALRATLYLVRVVEPTGQSAPETSGPEPEVQDPETVGEIEEQQQNEARVYLDRVAGDLRRHGPSVTWEVRIGRPADEIARLAETTAADLIVIATHGLNGARHCTFGSVTQELLHHTTVPVMVIPPGSHHPRTGRSSAAAGNDVIEGPITASDSQPNGKK